MKHRLATLGLVVAVALATGLLAFRAGSEPDVQRALAGRDALAWLRADFDLTDAQFARIQQLHDAYSVVCEEHCRQIQEATRALQSAKASRADPLAVTAAERRLEQVRLTCETAIATHVRQCAGEMSPAAGARYLALVLPKIKDFDHVAPPDVQLGRALPSAHQH